MRYLDLIDFYGRGDYCRAAPYNLTRETGGDVVSIALLVPGFSRDELVVRVDKNRLYVTGDPKETGTSGGGNGFAITKFANSWKWPMEIEVLEANLRHGILRIELALRCDTSLDGKIIAISE